jgi:NAD(P)-dependent dehydrogenase (short-subunit alcohol dehydrogenase family)
MVCMDDDTKQYAPQGTLAGRIALVAGATRGLGRAIALALGEAGATVYVTGRTTRTHTSEVGRPQETIEETGELVTAAGGTGIAVPTDHLDEERARALFARIAADHDRLDILVNDLWGGEHLVAAHVFGKKSWETPLADGLRMIDLGIRSHVITAGLALPLLIRSDSPLHVEVTDGTEEFNARRFRDNLYFDLAKTAPHRIAFALSEELAPLNGTALSVSPGYLRSEQMLAFFGVTEANWREGAARDPHFAIAESPHYLARGLAALAADPQRARWSGKSASSAELASAYDLTDVDGSRPDCFAYFRDVVFGGKKGVAEDYR